MWEDILAKLTKLSKEQLIYIIEQYRRATLRMSNALVRESMRDIHSTDACDIIRDCLQDCDFIRTRELAAYVDMKLGKISSEEYRDIMLGGDGD